MRSADECEMSRSCQSGTFSRPTTAAARTTRASPEIRSATFGLRLCGIADEPFMPGGERLLDLAHLGAREVADLGREPVERRRADARAPRAARRAGRARSPASRPGPARARAARRRCARPRGRSRRTCRPCPRAGRRGTPRARARARSRARSSSNAQPASFQPKVVGSAWIPCERPMQIVRRCSSARRTTAASARSMPASEQLAGVPDLQRERGVDDVRRRQPVVHPAPLRPELLGDGVDERGEVVVGRQLDLGDALGRRRRRAGADRGDVGGRDAPTSAQPSSAASSTSSQRASLPSSDQIRLISGRE